MHLALYRKWRSLTFDEVYGQDHVTSVLKYEAANNLISHAYLFCGPRGTGKTSCAKILARVINCENPQNGNPCNECHACKSILSDSAIDVIEMDAASNNGVDNIRDIRDLVVFTPAELRYRVYIVDEVHMLSTSAFNALLKTLEEPPSHVVFILATTELHKLPETVISRCQRFDFRRFTVPVISDRLEFISKNEGFSYTKQALDEIARISQGGMRDAISLLELCAGRHSEINEELVYDALGAMSYESSAKAAAAVAARDYDSLFRIISDITSAGRDISVFWDDLISFYRDMLVYKSVSKPSDFLDISPAAEELLRKTAENFTLADILYQCKLLDGASADISRAVSSKRMIAELTLVRMCDAALSSDNDALLSRIAALEDTVKLISAGSSPKATHPAENKAAIVKHKNKSHTEDNEVTIDKTADNSDSKSVNLNEYKDSEMDSVYTDKTDTAAESNNVTTALPYWSELLSRAADKNKFIDGFRQFISGYYDGKRYIITAANPFTYKICSDNMEMFSELLTVFEGKSIPADNIVLYDKSSREKDAQISLDFI